MQLNGIGNKEILGAIFDLDGLLVDSENLYWKANIQAAKEEKLDIPEDSYLKLAGATIKEMEEFYHQYFPTEQLRDNFIKRTDDLVWQWTDEGKLQLKPGAQAILDKFHQAKVHMAIASSNYDTVVQHAIWTTGIRNYFDFYLSYRDVKEKNIKAKPAPDIYLLAAQKLNIPKDNLIVFEDSPTGVEAAYNAGIDVIMIPDLLPASTVEKQRAKKICKNFLELL